MQIPAALNPVEEVKAKFGDALLHHKEFRGETTLIVDPAKLIEVLLFLRSARGLVYNFLSDISAVDYYPSDYGDAFKTDFRPERFGVSYHIYSMLYNRRLRVKAFAAEEDPKLPSVTPQWPAANWLEREIMDLMGVKFEGHPDKRRLLMPEDWDGHPHRRDYPMGKETVAFSFNIEDIQKNKPSEKE
jgi:NADH-quinone oxidoreductase subunit C